MIHPKQVENGSGNPRNRLPGEPAVDHAGRQGGIGQPCAPAHEDAPLAEALRGFRRPRLPRVGDENASLQARRGIERALKPGAVRLVAMPQLDT